MSQHETERIVEEFLGGHPRAAEWRALRRALEERLIGVRRERQREVTEGADEGRLAALDAQVAALDRQVATLETEEAVAQFVEDSVKFSVAQHDLTDEAMGEE